MYKNFYLIAMVAMVITACNNSSDTAEQKNEKADSTYTSEKALAPPPPCPIPPGLIIDEGITTRLRGRFNNGNMNGRETKIFKINVGYLQELINGLTCNDTIKITLAAYETQDVARYNIKVPGATALQIRNKPTLLFARPETTQLTSRAFDIAVICPPPGNCDFPLAPEKDSTKKDKDSIKKN